MPGQEAPWVVPADEPPDDVDLGAYGLRVWIEQGFRTLKRIGWQWHRTHRLAPVRVDRHGLVLAVATLWILAYGTRVEEARLRGLAPGQVRTPPLAPAPEPVSAGLVPGPSGCCTAVMPGLGFGCSPCRDRTRLGNCNGWTCPPDSSIFAQGCGLELYLLLSAANPNRTPQAIRQPEARIFEQFGRLTF